MVKLYFTCGRDYHYHYFTILPCMKCIINLPNTQMGHIYIFIICLFVFICLFVLSVFVFVFVCLLTSSFIYLFTSFSVGILICIFSFN